MSFAFEPHESLPHAVRRVAGRQVKRAIDGLRRKGHRPSPADIHDARKRLKRLRALLRLAREGLPGKARRRENCAFRDAGRALSAARDATVLVAALDGLLEGANVPARDRSFQPLRRALLARRREANRHPDAAEVRDIAKALRKAAKRVDVWKLKDLTPHALRAGLRRTYADGRRAMGRAICNSDPETLHEWRKRAKDLWHHAELLADVWSSDMKGFDEQVHHLSDLLGDDHDLAVLRQTLTDEAKALGASPELAATLFGWIDARRAELQQEAMSLGHHLYDRDPKRFVKQVDVCARE
jgi:CHAD domain-containing protein